MKIWGDIPKVQGLRSQQNNVSVAEKVKGVPSKKDAVSISSKAKDFQTVMKALKSIPDVRTDLVGELSSKYDAGSYDVSNNDVADKIIKSVQDSES